MDSKNATSIIRRGDGTQDASVFLPSSPPGAVTSTFAPTVERRDKHGNILPQEHQESQEPEEPQGHIHDYYLNRCDDQLDSNVLDALYYFAQETSFYSLYKIYETIKLNVDGNKDPTKGKLLQWTTYDKIMDFRDSAHCYDAVRDRGLYGGRHSRVESERQKKERIKQGKKIRSGSILDLPEAESFIRCLLKKWLDWKRYRAAT